MVRIVTVHCHHQNTFLLTEFVKIGYKTNCTNQYVHVDIRTI